MTREQAAILHRLDGWLMEKRPVMMEWVTRSCARIIGRDGETVYAVCRQDGTVELWPLVSAC
jgi:hypothetical protein